MTRRPGLLFVVCFGAGLATGLSRFSEPVVVGAAVAILAAAFLARAELALLLGAATLGATHGRVAAWAAEGGCTAVIPEAAVALRVRLLEPVGEDGGVAQARPLGAGCRGTVVLRWPRHRSVAAGTVAQVRGRWIPAPAGLGPARGTLLVHTAEVRQGSARAGDRLRSEVTATSQRLYGPRAAMVDALVLGRRADLDPHLRDAFSRSGLVHLLSISGFHVGLITAWVVLVGRLLGLPVARAMAVGAGVAWVYVAFLGWPAPAARAAVLAALLALGLARQHRAHADALLATSCLVVLLFDPWALVDLGGWLSVAALWGATTATRWSDRALGRGVGWRMLASSVGATLATAPITAGAFGSVAVIGIALNFVAIPLAAVAVPGVVASLLLAPWWDGGAEALAAGAGTALWALERVAVLGAAVPGGHLLSVPEPASALPWLVVLGAAWWVVRGRVTAAVAVRRWATAAAAAAWVGVAQAAWRTVPDDPRHLTLHLLDVGQGDAAAIRTPGGNWVLVDAGPRTRRHDAGRQVVAPFLERQGARRLAAVVVSHAHADHLGGLPAVTRRVPADLVLEPAAATDDSAYLAWLGDLAATGARWRAGRPGDRFLLDGVTFRLVHPAAGWAGWGEDLNEDSLVLLVEYGGFRAVFAGDIGHRAEAALAGRIGQADLLKVGHHGSRGSSAEAWLDELAPCAAVISVGRGNRYGHPAPEAVRRLQGRAASVWRTDRHGTVTVATDGQRMTVRAGRGGAQATYSTEATDSCSPHPG